jgi:hypothetical protein
MRVWSERVYGIPPEQVVGSTARTQFELRDGGPALVKTLDYLFVDDKGGKPVGIWQFIGRRPIACFGNSDGDQAMLQYTTINNPRPSFGLIVHHTDAEREFAYDADPKSSGKLVEALKEAPQHGWSIVDMKADWGSVFAFSDNQTPITAIDILLEPDATMLTKAEAANDRLLRSYPNGFALDETHRPHVTCLQRYVRTGDLEKVYEAIAKVLAEEKPTGWKLKAYKYYYLPSGDIGVAGIVVEPTDDLVRFQRKLIDAIGPFTVKTGTAAAFVTTKEDHDIIPPLIGYVADFVPNSSGKKFNPHVSVGVSTEEYLKKMLDEKFEPFTFSPVGVSVYHLGNFGTARTKLKSWKP